MLLAGEAQVSPWGPVQLQVVSYRGLRDTLLIEMLYKALISKLAPQVFLNNAYTAGMSTQ